MKHIPIVLASLMFSFSGIKSQTIVITFEGTVNGTPTPLDSIRVMNLTAGGDTTIYFPDNVLVLGSIGLDEAAIEAAVLSNQPNPFAGATDILIGTGRSGQLLVQVHDATGREVVSYAGNLSSGQHRFRFTAATPGVHVLTVIQDGRRAVHRMVAMMGDATGSSLTYAGGLGSPGTAKSDRSLFTWTPGDELRYIGYASMDGTRLISVIDEVPTVSAIRTFELITGVACPLTPTLADIDGHVYSTVQVGNQCWMAANLRTTRYRDGSAIPNETNDLTWTQLTNGAWCNYDNNGDYDGTYGKLYNWYAAADPDLCPQGWHVPTEAEWQQLEIVLGMPTDELDQFSWRGAALNVGGKLKATTLWNAPNTGANNESGFSGLPGGDRYYDLGYFYALGTVGHWWSASENGAENAWGRYLSWDNAGVARVSGFKVAGRSVRCVRD